MQAREAVALHVGEFEIGLTVENAKLVYESFVEVCVCIRAPAATNQMSVGWEVQRYKVNCVGCVHGSVFHEKNRALPGFLFPDDHQTTMLPLVHRDSVELREAVVECVRPVNRVLRYTPIQ